MASIRTERRDCRSHQSPFSIDHHLLPSLSHLRTSSEAWRRSSSPQGTLQCVRLSQGRLPDPTWKRRPGRPRGRWIDQLRRDNNRPPADQWKLAIKRGHGGRATLRPHDYAVTWPDCRKITLLRTLYLVSISSLFRRHCNRTGVDRAALRGHHWTRRLLLLLLLLLALFGLRYRVHSQQRRRPSFEPTNIPAAGRPTAAWNDVSVAELVGSTDGVQVARLTTNRLWRHFRRHHLWRHRGLIARHDYRVWAAGRSLLWRGSLRRNRGGGSRRCQLVHTMIVSNSYVVVSLMSAW